MQKKKLLFCLFFGAIHYSYPMEDANVSAHTSKTIPKDEMFNLAFKWSRENNVEKLESFFASIEWCMHANKEHMFEILLQNAIGQDNNLKTVQPPRLSNFTIIINNWTSIVTCIQEATTSFIFGLPRRALIYANCL
jgi:hypothetical protein